MVRGWIKGSWHASCSFLGFSCSCGSITSNIQDMKSHTTTISTKPVFLIHRHGQIRINEPGFCSTSPAAEWRMTPTIAQISQILPCRVYVRVTPIMRTVQHSCRWHFHRFYTYWAIEPSIAVL